MYIAGGDLPKMRSTSRIGTRTPLVELTLYSTSGCHLCESASRLLASMPELVRHPVAVVDIADDEALLARYGTRIPVLACRGREIGWPFNADDVLELTRR